MKFSWKKWEYHGFEIFFSNFIDSCQKEQFFITFLNKKMFGQEIWYLVHSENFKSAKITFCLIFSHHGPKICEILVNF